MSTLICWKGVVLFVNPIPAALIYRISPLPSGVGKSTFMWLFIYSYKTEILRWVVPIFIGGASNPIRSTI